MSYTASEQALLNLIIAKISGYTANNAKAGDEDAAFSYAIQNNLNCCVLDYAGGDADTQPSRITIDQLWMWSCVVTFFIRYNKDTIESDIRSHSDGFMVMFRDNKRLSNGTVWSVQAARAYQIIKRNDRPFIPLSFLVAMKTPI